MTDAILPFKNHAIRKADLKSRVIETIYPMKTSKKATSLWSWVLDKLGKKREVDAPSEEFHSDSLLFPWHLLKSTSNDLYVLNRRYKTLIASFSNKPASSCSNIVKGLMQ